MTIQELKMQNPTVALYSKSDDDYDTEYRYVALFRNEEGYETLRNDFILENCYGCNPSLDAEIDFSSLTEETQEAIVSYFEDFYEQIEGVYISVETFLPRTPEREDEELRKLGYID